MNDYTITLKKFLGKEKSVFSYYSFFKSKRI